MKKTYAITILASIVSCSQMDELQPQGGIILDQQLVETNALVPS